MRFSSFTDTITTNLRQMVREELTEYKGKHKV